MGVEYRIAIPTYNRPELIQKAALAWLERSAVSKEQVDVWVSGESQLPLYKDLPQHWRARMRIGAKGLVGNRRAAEAAYLSEGVGRVLWLNDDVFSVRRLAQGKKALHEVPIQKVADDGWRECQRAGAWLWGIYAVDNWFFMSERVHHDLRYVVGCFYGVRLPAGEYLQPRYGDAKEDYERALRFYTVDRRLVRLDYYSPKTIYYNSPEIFPDVQAVEENIRNLEQRWPAWVRRNRRKKSPFPEISIKDRGRA